MTTTPITAAGRAAALERMAQGVDVLVVGGGVTGAGIALDAATRGLRVGLVEGQDWASGTSSRSSKLVHGGLRYLQQLDFKLVGEALKERELLLRDTAPHLVRPISFLYPLHRGYERPYVATGIGMYDAMARLGGKATMPLQKHHTDASARRLFPDLREEALVGAVQYWDGNVDDARLVLTLVRTAAWLGADVANRARVEDYLHGDPADPGKVTGARVLDTESGVEHDIPAGVVVAAAGVWTEHTQQLAGAEGGLKVLASKGIHIVVERDRIAGEVGIIAQTEKSVLFVIPWNRYWIIGTTDTDYHEDLEHPVASAADIQYVLDRTNEVVSSGLTRDDVIGSFAGLRPLLQPGTKGEVTSTKVSREHTVTTPVPGLVTIAGGKLTTYRVMAEDAVDHALGARAKELPSLTERTPLLGAAGYAAYARNAGRITAELGCSESLTRHLLHRYGTATDDILALCREHPDLARPLAAVPAYLRAEIAYACTHEQAVHLEDLFVTRTRLTYEVRDHALAAIDEIGEIAAAHLGWDDARLAEEKAAYRRRCAAEDAASHEPDDAAAARARASVAQDDAPLVQAAEAD